jgi:2-polyprenyl-3-methyl-5-hydroxy-6-metoxy-1,4-benzoquinol methylase
MSGLVQAIGETERPSTGDDFEPLAAIFPVMCKYNVSCSPREFHEAVNLAFHAAEARVYDAIHRGMRDSLPRQFDLLSEDCLRHKVGTALRALDIGCGTGLSAQLLLSTSLGKRVRELHMLDTSEEMLDRALERAKHWPVRTEFRRGMINDLPAGTQYDLILTCSVLHHIPDISFFLAQVRQRQAGRGILLHLQDPNGDYLRHRNLAARIHRLNLALAPKRHWALAMIVRSLPPVIKRALRGLRARLDRGESHIQKTNEALIRQGVIRNRMTAADIWTVTDIHVGDAKGISIEHIKRCMPEYRLLSARSYAFFGKLASELPQAFSEEEERMITDNAPDGQQIGAAWMLSG